MSAPPITAPASTAPHPPGADATAASVESPRHQDVTDATAATAARAVRRGSARRGLATTARRLSGLLAVLLFWQYAATRGWVGTHLPSPAQVWDAAFELVRTGQLQTNLWASLQRVAKGLAFGLGFGLVLGLAAGLVKSIEDVVDPPMQALRMIPHLALVPAFIVWFGIGETSKVALILIGPLFPMYLNVVHGIRGVDNRLVEAAKSFGLGRTALIGKVIRPGALPQIFVGLRQALGIAWLSLVVAEQSAAPKGIGTLMSDARDSMRMDVIFVLLILYAVLGLVTDAFVRVLEHRALGWRQGFAGA
jgi:sulfonate transport system permease protein